MPTDCAEGAHGRRNSCRTERQLYKTRWTGGQGQVGGECVSILRSLDDSRFQGEVGTGGQHLSIFSLSVVFKAVGLDVTSWGRKVDREERGAKK